MSNKKCPKCCQQKSKTEFNKRKSAKDGLYTYCKECKKNDDKKYAEQNQEKIIKKNKEYYLKNKERISKQKKGYQEKTKDKRKIYKREYEKYRKLNDPVYKLTQNYKNRISKALKGIGKKSKQTAILLGCSVEEFAKHIENQFIEGMTWDNQGEWHVDHIIPISSAKTLKDREKLFHYTNCQPLWAKDNLAKSNKILSHA